MRANYSALAWTVLTLTAAEPSAIPIRVYDYAGVPESVMDKAKKEAQRVLSAGAVETEWLDCPPNERSRLPRHLACGAPMSEADIILRIVPRSMYAEDSLRGALGYALPFVGLPPNRAYVLYDRVRENIRTHHGISEFRLLAYVMAHEIAHLLLGSDQHYHRGVMMPQWRERDLVDIESGIMSFTREEGRRLRAGAILRMQRSSVVSNDNEAAPSSSVSSVLHNGGLGRDDRERR